VRIGLEHKGIAHQLVLIHLLRDGGEQNSAEFAAKNPMTQVPVLEIDGADGVFRLTQSMAILEYLEEIVPEPPLLPKPPELRARARELAEIVNSGIQPLQNLRFLREMKELGADPLPATRRYITTGLAALESHALSSSGTYLIGDDVSLADVYLVPQLYVARRFGVDLEPFPTLLRVERACEVLPAFKRAHANAQPDFDPNAK
jgi:maleylpyruvate isomerase